MKTAPDPVPAVGSVLSGTPDGARHVLRWTEWGDPENPRVLICAHGLSRNARDFDFLARTLMDRYRVVCPDFPGRGLSDRLSNPVHYHNFQYLQDSRYLIESLDFERLDWVGTSMGGLIGMLLASGPDNPLRRLVINDVGPVISGEALAGLGEYLSKHPRFPTLADAEEYFRTVYTGFGPLEDRHYRHLVSHGLRPAPDGDGYVLEVDPEVINQFVSLPFRDVAVWQFWNPIRIPTLILRGEESVVLDRDTLAEMKARHPAAESVEIPGCGHAPSLMVEDQIRLVGDWLERDG